MIGSLRISAFVLSLMMATSSMGAPVDVPVNPGAPTTPSGPPTVPVGGDLVSAAGRLLDCVKCSQSNSGTPPPPPPVVNPVPDASCNNGGLAYAVQTHTFKNNDAPKYSSLNIDFFKTATPIQTGFTKKIGFTNAKPSTPYSIYGGVAIKTDYIAVNHRGYFVPPKTGEYTISSDKVDDIALVWIGENAYNGRYIRLNASLEQGYTSGVGTKSYKITLEAGKYYAFRILVVNGQGAASFALSVSAPDGTVLISPNTDAETPFFVQFSCDGTSPAFQPFGKETA